MKIIVAGYGYVGKAVRGALENKNEIIVVDPKYTEVTIAQHIDADGIVICVSTPSDDVGNCDISNIVNVIDQVPIFIPILIKSTISPNLLKDVLEKYPDHSIVFSPEFLRAKSAIEDFANQKYMIIGGDDPANFWHLLFKDSLVNLKVIHKSTPEEAAVVKYATNSFLAIKVSFFNHLYDLCEATGQDFEVVRHLVCQDLRIGTSHSMVPGIDGERGWGGHCFPKDTLAFVQYVRSFNQSFDLLETAIEYNNIIKTNERI
jgi:UDPglucose 6-dehydrogenase